MKILLTGAGGFLGSALALNLLSKNYEVSLLIRKNSVLNRLNGQDSKFNIKRFSSDVEIEEFVSVVEPDIVIHTACSYGRQNESLIQISDANIRFSLLILQAIKNSKKPVSFINTGTVLNPDVGPYALTKHQFVQWGELIASDKANKIRFINVELQHMYGPGDDISKFTTHVLNACMKNLPTLELSEGEQKRDFIFIEDVVDAYCTIVEYIEQLKKIDNIEIGSGQAPTIREFVEEVHRLTSSQTKLLFGAIPYRDKEAMHCQANIEKIKSLGWIPKFDLKSGLLKTIEKEIIQ